MHFAVLEKTDVFFNFLVACSEDLCMAEYYATSSASLTISAATRSVLMPPLIYQEPGSATTWSIGMVWNQFLILDKV